MTDHPDMLEDFGWIVMAIAVVGFACFSAYYVWEWVL